MADCRICVQDCSIHEAVWKALKENCRNYKPKPMTSADRIRAMTDEKLAEWLEAHCYQYGWLDWLKQEAKE